MKIIIDAYQYSPSITGTDRMAFNFLRELQKIDKSNSYIILCSREQYTKSSITNKNFKVLAPPAICKIPFAGRYFSYIWRRLTKIRLISIKADIYFSFHNMSLPGRRLANKMIASNLDLIPITLDEYKNLGRNTPEEQLEEYKRVSTLADQFISISRYSKEELSAAIGVPKKKISVLYLAADNSFSAPTIEVKKDNTPKNKYILTIGGSEPRKNVQKIIDAYKLLPKKTQKEYGLTIAGGKWHGRKLEGIKSSNITQLGYVSDESLPSLYKNATAFVFASKYEGFGFTILEAMASGTPVINARGSSLDEVAGKATLNFNPDDPHELAEKITHLLKNKELQSKLIELGHKQNKKFSWEKSGKQLHRILTKG